eukprot:8443268-Pyramimonas_sp.AAC.1
MRTWGLGLGEVKHSISKQKTSVARHRRRSRGGGGLWRALVKLRTDGQIGRPDLSAVALEYHALKASNSPVLHDVREVARAATLSFRAQRQHGSRTKARGFGASK